MRGDFFRDAVDNLFLGVCAVNKNQKITYWNKGAENLTGFKSSEVMGKSFKLSAENCPISAALSDGDMRDSQAFIKHKKGKKVHVSFRVSPNNDERDGLIGASVMFHDISSQVVLINKLQELQKSASYDFLTTLPNRRLFEQTLHSRLEEAQRTKKSFGLLFVDIDNFKKVNDNYGHEVGDLVLKMVAKKLLDKMRPYDMLSRWGGEEFVALVPNIDREQLHAVSNRLRMTVEQASVFTGNDVVKVTLSMGATMSYPDDSFDSLLKRADKLMYISKTSGKNKVTVEVRN